jgi:hypothetical protein
MEWLLKPCVVDLEARLKAVKRGRERRGEEGRGELEKRNGKCIAASSKVRKNRELEERKGNLHASSQK